MPQLEVLSAEIVVVNSDLIRREAAAMCGFAAVGAMIPGRHDMEWTSEPPKGNLLRINGNEVDGEIGWVDVLWGSINKILIKSSRPVSELFPTDSVEYPDVHTTIAGIVEPPEARVFALVLGGKFEDAKQKVVREIWRPDSEDFEHDAHDALPLLLAD